MFMQFLGIGIGHCGQHVSVEPNPDDPQMSKQASMSTVTMRKVLRSMRIFRLRTQRTVRKVLALMMRTVTLDTVTCDDELNAYSELTM